MISIEGSARDCGRVYGEQERESIVDFLNSQIALRPDLLNFAAECWTELEGALPGVAEFCKGLAEGAALTISQMTLLLLHEEIVHQEHCSLVGVCKDAARDGRGAIAQNWDWPATVSECSRLVRLRTDSAPATLTYAFPGLWACAGVNEAGLAICWSGAGYWPSVEPVRGIPTYALVAGLLAACDVAGALKLLGSRRHAGCFIFLLADRGGELAVVEGWSGGGLTVTRSEDVACRTNHFLSDEAIAAVDQRDPASIKESTTAHRLERLRALVAERRDRLDGGVLSQILRHKDVLATYDVEDARTGYQSMTIDSLCAYPDAAELWVARGRCERHHFVRHAVDGSSEESPGDSREVVSDGQDTGTHSGAGIR